MAERWEARREYQRAYYQAHKEEVQKRNREYHWKNKENREETKREPWSEP